ncbi:MAG: response regulator [Gammaproteobacteria bacterium]
MTTRIGLVDDQQLFLEGLARLLDEEAHLEVVYTSTEAAAAPTDLERARPDLLIVDFMMPGTTGIGCIHSLRERYPGLRILGMSAYATASYRDAMLDAGAHGFVAKNSGYRRLLRAVETVMAGSVYVDPDVPGQLSGVESVQRRLASLSAREAQVARLLAQGTRYADIAQTLNISEKSVATYRSRVMQKLELDGNAGLVRLGLHSGWV